MNTQKNYDTEFEGIDEEIIMAEMQEYFCQYADEEDIQKEEEYYFTHRSMKEAD